MTKTPTWLPDGSGIDPDSLNGDTVVETLNGSDADTGEQETGHRCEPYYSRAECGQCGWQEQPPPKTVEPPPQEEKLW